MSELPPTASDFFGQMADSYDSLIRRAVPRYDEMMQRLDDHLPTAAARILELGCGTGNLTLRLAARYPAAVITAVDAAAEMTDLTARRVASIGFKGLSTLTARFEDLEFPAAGFDLVCSSMSLHHVRNKAPLYQRIGRWLTPRGSLRFADQLHGATEEIQNEFWRGWLVFCREPGHCTEEEIKSLEEHAAAHDHYEPFTAHFHMLTGAGFRMVDCVWRNFMYSVVIADKESVGGRAPTAR